MVKLQLAKTATRGALKEYTDRMSTKETYSDGKNWIVIHSADDGVTVEARISTKPPYTGGANAEAARAYAAAHGLALS